jgi:hypothetical protein
MSGPKCRHEWVICGPDYLPDSFYGSPEDAGRQRCMRCLRYLDCIEDANERRRDRSASR